MTRAEINKRYREKNKEKIKQINKSYRENNQDKIKEKDRKYQELNKDKIKQKSDNWYKLNKHSLEYKERKNEKYKNWYDLNKDNRKKYKEKYRELNRDNINEYRRNYYKNRKANDVLFKISCNIRNLIQISIKSKGYTKRSKTYKILGCAFEEFKQYLESKFEPWMTWENYGKYNGELNYGWDIDHIIPVSKAINEEGVIVLNHYTNLQPLCSKVNRDIKKDN